MVPDGRLVDTLVDNGVDIAGADSLCCLPPRAFVGQFVG